MYRLRLLFRITLAVSPLYAHGPPSLREVHKIESPNTRETENRKSDTECAVQSHTVRVPYLTNNENEVDQKHGNTYRWRGQLY